MSLLQLLIFAWKNYSFFPNIQWFADSICLTKIVRLALTKSTTVESMQNTVKWGYDRFWYICHYSWMNNVLEPLVKWKWYKFRGVCLHSTSVVILLTQWLRCLWPQLWSLKKLKWYILSFYLYCHVFTAYCLPYSMFGYIWYELEVPLVWAIKSMAIFWKTKFVVNLWIGN